MRTYLVEVRVQRYAREEIAEMPDLTIEIEAGTQREARRIAGIEARKGLVRIGKRGIGIAVVGEIRRDR